MKKELLGGNFSSVPLVELLLANAAAEADEGDMEDAVADDEAAQAGPDSATQE